MRTTYTHSTHIALEYLRRSADERRRGHADADDRGRLLVDIDRASDLREWSQAELHDALGLPQGSLRDGSLTTSVIRDAFLKLIGNRT